MNLIWPTIATRFKPPKQQRNGGGDNLADSSVLLPVCRGTPRGPPLEYRRYTQNNIILSWQHCRTIARWKRFWPPAESDAAGHRRFRPITFYDVCTFWGSIKVYQWMSAPIRANLILPVLLQLGHRAGPLWEAAAEQPEKVQLFPLCGGAVRPGRPAHRDRADGLHRVHREGPGSEWKNQRRLQQQ